jgi:uncharacterized protein (DUF58 family)
MRDPAVRRQFKASYLPILVGLLLLLQLLSPYKGWVILLAGLGGAWLVSHLWARSLANGLELRREMRFGWRQVGDHLQECFTLVNKGWAPAHWVAVLDHSNLPGYQVSTARPIGARALIHWFKRGVCSRRGLYTLGPTTLQASDPFGFYAVSLHYAATYTMMVMPPVVHLPTIDVAPGGRASEGRRLTRASTPDRLVSASSVREYTPGDSVRWLHWPSSARRDQLLVKTFDHTPSSDWWIYLDMNRRAQAGEGQTSTEEHGVILAASLADQGLRMGKAVGLVACAEEEELIWLPPRLSGHQRWEILRALALISPGKRSLVSLLEHTRPAVKQRSSVVIITPDVEAGWLDLIALLMRRGITPTVLLLDPAAFRSDGDPGSFLEEENAADRALASLSALEIAHYRITPDLLDQPEARPGHIGQWRKNRQGRWEPEFHHQELSWRQLA